MENVINLPYCHDSRHNDCSLVETPLPDSAKTGLLEPSSCPQRQLLFHRHSLRQHPFKKALATVRCMYMLWCHGIANIPYKFFRDPNHGTIDLDASFLLPDLCCCNCNVLHVLRCDRRLFGFRCWSSKQARWRRKLLHATGTRIWKARR